MEVPFVDLKTQLASIDSEINHAIQSVLNDSIYIGGKYVSKFEEEFANVYGVKHCLGVANGTDAIYVALKMLGIGSGDEVITVANSWIATAEAISQTGAVPVFVDIDDHFNIDSTKIEGSITSKTKAIVPVHLFGHPADLDPIMDLCKKYSLYLVEDCAQAHFAKYKGKNVGTFGDAATFSFYPSKNLGAYGDAGAVITNNSELDKRCRMFANNGSLVRHEHKFVGINSRIDTLQAAILSVKLKYVGSWNDRRREIAALYYSKLQDAGLVLPKEADYAKHVYHLFVIKVEERDKLKERLKESLIGTEIHYPTAIPLLPAYKHLNYSVSDIPVAHDASRRILSLPMFPELTEEQIDWVCSQVLKFTPSFH